MRRTIRLVESMASVRAIWDEMDATGAVTDEIAELESAWNGGVADFGDRRAAHHIVTLPQYAAYQAALVEVLRRHVGFPLVVYRLMPEEVFNDFLDAPSSDAWATSLSRRFVERFASFARQRATSKVVVQIRVYHPEAVIMRGKADEQEIVIDPYHAADWVGEPHFTVVNVRYESP